MRRARSPRARGEISECAYGKLRSYDAVRDLHARLQD